MEELLGGFVRGFVCVGGRVRVGERGWERVWTGVFDGFFFFFCGFSLL